MTQLGTDLFRASIIHQRMESTVTQNHSQLILRTDATSMPMEWINYQNAVRLHCLQQIAYSCGNKIYRIRGGINAISRKQSIVELHSIVATYGHHTHKLHKRVPPLNNPALFRRDAFLCMYCGHRFSHRFLSRDHILPLSMGGTDSWNNVVTACRNCNNHKAGRTPEQAKMQLLAIPFTPNHAEYVFLQARRILADQMEFLKMHFPRNSRLRTIHRH